MFLLGLLNFHLFMSALYPHQFLSQKIPERDAADRGNEANIASNLLANSYKAVQFVRLQLLPS